MKILSYFLSPFFLLTFYLLLVIFQPIQWIGLRFFGKKTHAHIVAILNYFLVKSMLIIGIIVRFKNDYKLPKNTPLIFISNHQSIADIPPLNWFFRKHFPKFVAKIELSKGFPSVSYNLRNGGGALIDRKDPKQSIIELVKYSKRIQQHNWGAVIFPEGTRSKTGVPKPFAKSGVKIITKYNPNAYIVPVTINNSWKLFKYGSFPFGLGFPISILTHKPIKVDSLPFEELIQYVERTIINSINEN